MNQQNDQLAVGLLAYLLAYLLEHCTGHGKGPKFDSLRSLNFFKASFSLLLKGPSTYLYPRLTSTGRLLWEKVTRIHFWTSSCGYTSDFLLAMMMRFFLEIVASPARGGGYTSDKVCDFVAKSSTHWISRNFFSAIF